MIEYLYDAIRATSGEDLVIDAVITETDGTPVDNKCALMLHSENEMIGSYAGKYYGRGVWEFVIPTAETAGMSGRYYYSICENDNKLCFKQPIYFM